MILRSNSHYFQLSTTADGSPTLQVGDPDNLTERMHSPKGAFTETLYIYGQALEFIIEHKWPLQILSIGLGLAYNEIMTAAVCLKTNTPIQSLHSYELIDDLRENFIHWLEDKEPRLNEITPLYEQINKRMAEHFNIPAELIKKTLVHWHQNGQLKIHPAFDPNLKSADKFTGILFDAFSTKTSPELWTQLALENLIHSFADKNCVISTYAATGILKRVLKERGFTNTNKDGFGGKRESTFAWRNS